MNIKPGREAMKTDEDVLNREAGTIAVRVSPSLMAATKRAAEREGLSLSAVARRALLRELRTEEAA
ncbi:MAG: hypothetical protein GEU95_10375 [Rhizobiales bacterium]|nr:hypothetical protein [Hyphomicrobiales bacterium]